ncbi:hypothetical protein [Chryseobacterium sp. FH1]|uniref:hypothetical protein n=1 Tax=Chryseobacterium sp. FH1 TaxID=1233951 RepID=UPI0004E2B907|nr:hypothetical protein [Chryseobacterium sp. FH1]KFC24414.1 hypothetical protein IO90_03725 [Chryseobacterium sp. FH1]
MSKLIFYDNSYHVEKKKRFSGILMRKEIIEKSCLFSYKMAFQEGFHRSSRSGGDMRRNQLEIFTNTFQGKIGEFVVKDELEKRNLNCSEVDLDVFGKGIWDNGDLIVNGKNLNVKSMAFFSNLLLLEKKDWSREGIYLKDTDNETKYDYFVAARIKPNVKEIFTKLSEPYTLESLTEIISRTDFYFDIPGAISAKTLTHVIDCDYIIEKNTILNGKTIMDADNYYVQSGDLASFEILVKALCS